MKILDEIRGRLEAAAPGPWFWDEKYDPFREGDSGLALTNAEGTEIVGAYNHHCCSFRADPDVNEESAPLIANAPTDIARMLAALDAAERECRYLDTLADGDRHYAASFRRVIAEALEDGK